MKSTTEDFVDLPESDENFAYIAGYTEGGFPYGTTWEEAEEIELAEAQAANIQPPPQACPVSLKQVAKEMQVVSDLISVYFKRSTCQFLAVSEEYVSVVEDGEDEEFSGRPEWEKRAIQETSDVLAHLHDGDYVPLPSQYEIHEYSIIEDFCYSIDNDRVSDDLFRAIKGKGAFRKFKDAIYRHSIQKQWFSFRDAAFLKIAREWCEENGISWCE